jgi:hypothetical protein
MSEAIADLPITENRTVADAPKTSAQLGLKTMAQVAADFAKSGGETKPTETKGEIKQEAVIDKVDTSLLGKIETPKEPKKEAKTTKEDDIRTLKTARDEFKKNWETTQAELEKIKTTFVAPERLTAAEKRAAEMEAKLEIQALADSPKFARDFTEPRIQLVEQGTTLIKEVLGEEGVMERAMSLTGKARREFLDEAFANSSPSALAEVAGLLASIDTLDRRKSAALSNWKTERDRMSEAERASAMKEAADERNEILKAFDASRNEVAAKIPGYREVIGDAENNAQVEAKFAKARQLLTGEASQRDQAIAPYLAVECADALKREAALTEENRTLKERLAKYDANQPGVGGGSDGGDPSAGKMMGMLERVKLGI